MPQISGKSVTAESLSGRYRFLRKLSSGGGCDVFHAIEKNGRQVAVKMMQTGKAGEAGETRRVSRFRREMQSASRLRHPRIVQVLDAGETDTGLLFLVFEFIDGPTLGDLLKKQGALPVATAASVAMHVLEALGAAHGNGIVHRDLKPENILIAQGDSGIEAKVLDFGISGLLPSQWGQTSRLTLTREFLGTPTCASPEQLRGEPVGPKADIYAWGITFLECLTGKSPFDGASIAAIVQQQLSATPVPVPSLLRDHPLGSLLRWALEKDASRRAGNALHLLDRLRGVSLDGIPTKNGFLPAPESFPQPHGGDGPKDYRAQTPLLERRQVSALCLSLSADCHGAQTSSDVIDEIYHDLLQLCLEKSKNSGGYIAGEAGDRLLVYFGFPHASDTDVRRAIRAALLLSDSLLRRSAFLKAQHGFIFSHQIGMHTGMVTVRSAGQIRERISGITPSLVARLCGAAAPNTILISEESRSLLKNLVECELAEPVRSNPSASALTAYKVIGERAGEALRGLDNDAQSPMIGREFELDLIVRSWNEAKRDGQGRVIFLQGEAGMGKSRLAAECGAVIQKEGHGGWLEVRFTPETRNSALFCFLETLKTRLGFSGRTRSGQEQRKLLEDMIDGLGMPRAEAMPLFCAWLGLPAEGYPLPDHSPQRAKTLFLEQLSRLFARLAKDSDAVILLEDMHWSDPTSLEMLPLLIGECKRAGRMLMISARPEFEPPWDPQEAVTIRLDTLDGREAERLIVEALQGEPIEKELLHSMVERSGGVALFALELARMYRVRGRYGRSGRTTQAHTMEIPGSLRDLLAGRLDRAGPAKETAQVASALGRTFSFDVLAKVSWQEEALVLSDLDQLVSEGLLNMRLRVGNPEYQFQHALVREAAYDTLAPKAKADLHLRIAQTLEREFPGMAGNQPEVFAMHWAGAGEYGKAIEYGIKAAGGFLSKALLSEAIAHGESVLAWIQELPTRERPQSEFTINGILTQARMFKFGWADPGVKELAERSRDLLAQTGHGEHSFPTLWTLATHHHLSSNRRQVRELTAEMDAFAARSQDSGIRVATDTFLGLGYMADGDYRSSAKYLERAIRAYDPVAHAGHGELYGLDTRVWSAATLALILWEFGHDSKAAELSEANLRWAEATQHKPSIAMSLLYRSLAAQALGNRQAVLEKAGELVEISDQFGLPAYSGYGGILLCWATGDIVKADQHADKLFALGCRLGFPLCKCLAAENEAKQGDFTAALARIDACLKLCDEMDEQFYKSALHYRKGFYLGLAYPADREAAMRSFETAFRLALEGDMTRLEWVSLLELQKLSPSRDKLERMQRMATENPELAKVTRYPNIAV